MAAISTVAPLQRATIAAAAAAASASAAPRPPLVLPDSELLDRTIAVGTDAACIRAVNDAFRVRKDPRGGPGARVPVGSETETLRRLRALCEGRRHLARYALAVLKARGALRPAHLHAVAAASPLVEAHQVLAGCPFDAAKALSLLRACRRAGDPAAAAGVLGALRTHGVPASAQHYAAALLCHRDGCSAAGAVDLLWAECTARGLHVGAETLVLAYVEACGRRAAHARDRHVRAAEEAWTEHRRRVAEGGGGGAAAIKWYAWVGMMKVYARTADAGSGAALLRLARRVQEETGHRCVSPVLTALQASIPLAGGTGRATAGGKTAAAAALRVGVDGRGGEGGVDGLASQIVGSVVTRVMASRDGGGDSSVGAASFASAA